MFPLQGEWTEQEYLALETNRLIEFSDGLLEFLPMPTMLHQALVEFLHALLKEFVGRHDLGRAFFAPLPIRLWPGKFREPDLMFIARERLPSDLRRQPDKADLVMEVLSPGERNRQRDLETKREEYATAGIREYWIVDPEQRRVHVLALDGNKYRVHGEFGPGQKATSVLLDGFVVSVDELFASAEPKSEQK